MIHFRPGSASQTLCRPRLRCHALVKDLVRAPWGPKAAQWSPKKGTKERAPYSLMDQQWESLMEIHWYSLMEIHRYSLMVSNNEYRWISSSLNSNSLKKQQKKQWKTIKNYENYEKYTEVVFCELVGFFEWWIELLNKREYMNECWRRRHRCLP